MSMTMTLGKTGIKVKRLGFGGIPIQRVSEREAIDVVKHAVESGIDFIDTARGYSNSEERIGKALKELGRTVTLATKTQKRTAEEMRSEIELSLKTLQVDYIDLYQTHFVNTEEVYQQIIGPGGAYEALTEAKEKGLIKHIGLTTHSLDLAMKVIEGGLFETIMVCFGVLEPKAMEEVIPAAHKAGMGVLAMKPFAGGVLDESQTQVGLKYSLSHDDILVLGGVERKDLFDRNWAVYSSGDWTLTEADEQALDAIRGEFGKSFCRRCDYCQPCTEGIKIQAVLGLPSQVKRMGWEILTRSPRKDVIAQARNCSRCEECLPRCPYKLPIPDLIEERLEWIDRLLAEQGK